MKILPLHYNLPVSKYRCNNKHLDWKYLEKSNLSLGRRHRFSNTLEDWGRWGQVFSPSDAIKSGMVTKSSITKHCCKTTAHKTMIIWINRSLQMPHFVSSGVFKKNKKTQTDGGWRSMCPFSPFACINNHSLLLFSSGVRLKPHLRDWKSWRETWVPKSRS